MAFLIGAIIGGFIWAVLIGLLVERFLFRELGPTQRAAFTVGSAWAVTAVIAGFGFSRGGSFAIGAGLFYLPGAFAAFFIFRSRYLKAWFEDDQ